jgi:transposase-like protein
MMHRVRSAMGEDNGPLFTVADETYIGGDPKNWHASDPRKANVKRGRGTHKTPVVSVIESKTGRTHSRAVADVTGRTLRKAITDNVDMAFSTLHTHALPACLGIGAEMAGHFYVDHSAGEYGNDKTNGTNLAECFFSQVKRSLDGTHHNVSREHLHRYLGEFDFRFGTSKLTDAERMALLVEQADGRLPYRAGWCVCGSLSRNRQQGHRCDRPIDRTPMHLCVPLSLSSL